MSTEGLVRLPGLFTPDEQEELIDAVREIDAVAPFALPTLRDGTPLRVRVTSAGKVGWWGDTLGYRYITTHPFTGEPWPETPPVLAAALRKVLTAARAHYPIPPFYLDTCLFNRYQHDGSLGLHRDLQEEDGDAPILSISLGAPCSFAVGGAEKDHKIVERFILSSGDAMVMAGPARQRFHGVERLLPPMLGEQHIVVPGLIEKGQRINVTMRQVFKREAPR
jgi:alkylated DNA repair protein (DNA oxidative demethylase)